MAVTAKIYANYFLSVNAAKINWASDTINIMLLNNVRAPVQGTDAYKSIITNEVVGTAYVAGGYTLAAKTNTVAGLVATFDNTVDPAWNASSITARYAVVYDSTPGTDATRPLIMFIDFGADIQSTGGTFSIVFDPAGIFTLTAA